MMNVKDAFFNKVYEYTRSGEDIMVVSSDIGAPSLDDFRKDFPQRFVNVGIAEQNSLAVAAGLELTGKKVITYGLNPFPVTRAFDQIRNIMASFKIPITVTGLKVGTCTAEAGFSHTAVENLSLLRTLHNIRIINPSDETISRMAVREIISKPEPRYIQFDPSVTGSIYSDEQIDFERGFVKSGTESDVAVVTYGAWAREIMTAHLNVRLIDCFSLPLNEDDFLRNISGCRKIITVEDGVAEGGLGSMVLEILNDHNLSIPVERMALRFKNDYPKTYTTRKRLYDDESMTIGQLEKLV